MSKPVSQDMFPGSYIEPDWTRIDAIDNIAYYAIRLLAGSIIIDSPATINGDKYKIMVFDGCRYAISQKNFEMVVAAADDALQSYFLASGYDIQGNIAPNLRHDPNMLLTLHRHITSRVRESMEIDRNKTRVFWVIPDKSGCGHFRSDSPYRYLKANAPNTFFTEASDMVSYKALSYYDAIVIHRSPNPTMLHIVESLKSEGKIIIYETDDDFFNIPEFNVAGDGITKESLGRILKAIDLADIVITTTPYLAGKINKPEKTFVCPNLIDVERYEKSDINRPLNLRYLGKHPVEIPADGTVILRDNSNEIKEIAKLDDVNNSNPIIILWTGSNTHDGDLKQIIQPIMNLGNKYGLAIRFVFQGYLPTVFAETTMGKGNTDHRMVVKNEYAGFIQYVPPVEFKNYHEMLNSIKPDFALCPITDHEFNLSKSSIKPLEMAALGVPSVCADFGPYQIMTHHENALLVKPGDEEGWENAIELLITNSELRGELGLRAYDFVWNEWSWKTINANRNAWDAMFGQLHKMTEIKKARTATELAAMLAKNQKP